MHSLERLSDRETTEIKLGCDWRVVVDLKDVVESDDVRMIKLFVNVVLTQSVSTTTATTHAGKQCSNDQLHD